MHDTMKAATSKSCFSRKYANYDVEREPHLQPVAGDVFTRSINTGDKAKLDLKAIGLWRRGLR